MSGAFLSANAQIRAHDKRGKSPLHLAALGSNQETFEALRRHNTGEGGGGEDLFKAKERGGDY
jgi:ankyrin repeat protein